MLLTLSSRCHALLLSSLVFPFPSAKRVSSVIASFLPELCAVDRCFLCPAHTGLTDRGAQYTHRSASEASVASSSSLLVSAGKQQRLRSLSCLLPLRLLTPCDRVCCCTTAAAAALFPAPLPLLNYTLSSACLQAPFSLLESESARLKV